MFTLLMVVFVVIFTFAFVTIVMGIWTTTRLTSKVFRAVEQEMDRKLSEGPSPTDSATASNTAPKKSQCAHCGVSVTATDRCPNCGASLV